MIKTIGFLLRQRYEHRKIKRVITHLELEEARVRLDPHGKEMGDYLRALRRYLEES